MIHVIKFLSSIKLAVIVILFLAVISAVGMFTESRYDARTAQKLVYQSWFMYLTMGLLIVNLVFSAVDRLPWKRRHLGFLIAHISIITLIMGSYITQKRGVDGTMAFSMGEKRAWVSLHETQIRVYATLDGNNFRSIHEENIDFLKSPLPKEGYTFNVGGVDAKVINYIPYAIKEMKVVANENKESGAALRFAFQNQFATVSDWLIQEGSRDKKYSMGPAEVVLSTGEFKPDGKNQLFLKPLDMSQLYFELYSKDKKRIRKGRVRPGEVIQTPWMGGVFRILKYLPHSKVYYSYKEKEYPTELTTQAIEVVYGDERQWLGLNGLMKVFGKNENYIIMFASERVNLGFDLELKKFEIERYPGSQQAKSYQSLVGLETGEDVLISMNEPLKYKGYTFYQASFEEDENGVPTTSVLSVNYDPGRWIKYSGSAGMVLGFMILFYDRRRRKKA